MQKENRIIHGNCQLQNTSGRIGYERYFSKDQVCSTIQHDRHADGDHKQNRFKPGRCRQKKDDEYDWQCDQHDLLDFLTGMYRRKHIGNCSSGHCIVITDDLTDRINSCFLFCIIAAYCNGKQGIGVFVPGFYCILIRKFQWLVNINRIIQPGNLLNAFGFFYFFFIF